MAAAGFQPLTEAEVREQLQAIGYHNFSPEKVSQITKDLAAYLAEEGLLSDSTANQSFVSDTSTAYHHSTASSPRQPLQDVYRGPTRRLVRFEQPERPGKENQQTSPGDVSEEASYFDDPSFDSTRSDQSYTREAGQVTRPSGKSKPVIKRKVVRKRNGRSQIFDESITESESDVSYLNDRLAQLRLPLREEQLDEDDTVSESSTGTQRIEPRRRSRSSSSRWSETGSSQCSEEYSNQPLKSFIRPASAPVKWKHSAKTDPVTRHQMYAAQWKSVKAPGEQNHKGLRWQIREQMLYKDDVTLPRNQPRVYVPNTYQVPTEKKRQALRWAVRHSLANKEMPYSSFNF